MKFSGALSWPAMVGRRFSMATSIPAKSIDKFETAFDIECADYVVEKLSGSSVELKCCDQSGHGLYATRGLQKGQLAIRQAQLLSFPPTQGQTKLRFADRVDAVAGAAPSAAWVADFVLVAQAVAAVLNSAVPQSARSLVLSLSGLEVMRRHGFANSTIPLRCLGWTNSDTPDNIVVQNLLFRAISVYFGLDEKQGWWTPTQCQLLYDKVKSNCFRRPVGTQLFELVSLLNHSCHPNVAFLNLRKPDELVVLRDIAKGDQLYIDYMVAPNDLPELYGFTCTCERCLPIAPRTLTITVPGQRRGPRAKGDGQTTKRKSKKLGRGRAKSKNPRHK